MDRDYTLLFISIGAMLLAGYLNPMNWYSNFRFEPSLYVFVMVGVQMVSGITLGFALRGVVRKAEARA